MNGFHLIWIDACCIDKTSSAELSEAINSMYAWYASARVCYVYLADVSSHDDHHAENSQFRQSVWFTRGWTLQELIAPFKVIFLAQDWVAIGPKRDLVDLIEEITGIAGGALLHEMSLDTFSVAQRLSWASKRETTRVEDEAYSLLGIFDINMPTLYGEGERAFRRLQEEIMQHIPDQSLFVGWSRIYQGFETSFHSGMTLQFTCTRRPSITSLFAQSPAGFEAAGSIVAVPHHDVYRRLHLSQIPALEYTPTPHGIRMQLPLVPLSHYFPPSSTDYPRGFSASEWYLAILCCESSILHPDCVLGRVCYLADSESGIESLHCDMVQINWGNGGGTWYNLFPLSPATIKRCRSKIKLRTVYITHPDRTNMTAQAATLWPHADVHLTLTGKVADDLFARGYVAHLRGPDEGHPTTHMLSLESRGRHTIVVAYHHTLAQDGRALAITGSATASGHDLASSSTEEGGPENPSPSSLVWSDMLPWQPSLRWYEVGVAIPDRSTIDIGLGVDLVWQSHYSLDVQILADTSTRDSRRLSVRFKTPFQSLRRAVGQARRK